MLEVEVRDTGVGISRENQATVFDPFIQADTSTPDGSAETGLGLTIAKRLAQALEGDVCLKESVEGKGSIFEFHMRCESATTPDLASQGSANPLANRAGNHELAGLKFCWWKIQSTTKI